VSVGAVALAACVGCSSSVRRRGLLQQVSRLLTVLYCSPPWRWLMQCIFIHCAVHTKCLCFVLPAQLVQLSFLVYIYTGCWNRKKHLNFSNWQKHLIYCSHSSRIHGSVTTNQQCNRVKRMNFTSELKDRVLVSVCHHTIWYKINTQTHTACTWVFQTSSCKIWEVSKISIGMKLHAAL
jgi:hypothetical protein